MKDTVRLVLGILLGFFSFVAVAYLVFLVVTMAVWLMGAI